MSRDPAILSIRAASTEEKMEGHADVRINIVQTGLASGPVDVDYITKSEALQLAESLITAVRRAGI